MRHGFRTYVVIWVGVAGWLFLAPASAEAQRGRAVYSAGAHSHGSGYGYGPTGPRGGLGHHKYYGGYTTAFGNGYGNGTPWNDGYATSYPPMVGYSSGGDGFYRSGYPSSLYGNGVQRGNTITYRRERPIRPRGPTMEMKVRPPLPRPWTPLPARPLAPRAMIP